MEEFHSFYKHEQAWFWSASWQEAEAEAEADIKAGRVKKFASAEAMLRDLDA